MNFDQSPIPEHLIVYYQHLFPLDSLVEWLQDSKGHLNRREFSFITCGDVFYRYKSYQNKKELHAHLTKRTTQLQDIPARIDIGAIYRLSPDIEKDRTPEEKEFVIDIDIWESAQKGCCRSEQRQQETTTTKICPKCWPFVTVGVTILDHILMYQLGLDKRLWVFSGRRGMHCWVFGDRARKLTNAHRQGIASYLKLIPVRDFSLELLRDPPLVRAWNHLLPWFEKQIQELPDFWFALINKQRDFICKLPKLNAKLKQHAVSDQKQQERIMLGNRSTSPTLQWNLLKQLVSLLQMDPTTSHQELQGLQILLPMIVLSAIYPEIDINVSQDMGHLLKSPFSVHPATGRICIPVDPEHIADFDYRSAPILSQLIKELDEKKEEKKTNLLLFKKACQWFDKAIGKVIEIPVQEIPSEKIPSDETPSDEIPSDEILSKEIEKEKQQPTKKRRLVSLRKKQQQGKRKRKRKEESESESEAESETESELDHLEGILSEGKELF